MGPNKEFERQRESPTAGLRAAHALARYIHIPWALATNIAVLHMTCGSQHAPSCFVAYGLHIAALNHHLPVTMRA